MVTEVNKLMILGAGGHGRVVAEIAQLTGKYTDIAFLDDKAPEATFPYPYVGKCKDFADYLTDYVFFIAIGNAHIRRRLQTEVEEAGGQIITLIHPAAIISKDVKIGKGTVVMAGAIVNTGAKIGDGVILNTASSVDHDCVVEDFCHVSVGAHLCGTVLLGAGTWVAAGATVINNVTICSDCLIGAGATVTHDLLNAGIYKGTPAVYSHS
jgi:sugar O-acyltransferase (sialic acid O-acetyltransferase NeuD family)